MNGQALFPPKVLLACIAAMVLTFVASGYFFLHTQEDEGTERAGANSYSHSAIGYAGIVEVLRRGGVKVEQSRAESLSKLEEGGLLVLAEPKLTAPELARLLPLMAASDILLILPKWQGLPDPHRPAWLAKVGRDEVEARTVLGHAVRPAQITRATVSDEWLVNRIGAAPGELREGQLVQAAGLTPIVSSDKGMLVGELLRDGRRLWVLSDPDLIDNQAKANPTNIAFAVALINLMRKGGPVVFDETIHGFQIQAQSPFLLMFQRPFVFVTLLIGLTLALLLWATTRRFGAALPATRPLEAGKLGLLRTAARLLEFAGYQRSVTRRYMTLSVADAARRLRAPPAMTGEVLVAWLDGAAETRGLTARCRPLYDRVQSLSDAPGGEIGPLLRLARDIHQWKGEITHGLAERPRGR